MPRNFGNPRNLYSGGDFDRFWNEQPENARELRWPYWVSGAAVAAMIVIGMFMP